jgi:hypothetical protein
MSALFFFIENLPSSQEPPVWRKQVLLAFFRKAAVSDEAVHCTFRMFPSSSHPLSPLLPPPTPDVISILYGLMNSK